MDDDKCKRQELMGKMPTGNNRLAGKEFIVVEVKPEEDKPGPWEGIVAELMGWRW